MANTLRKRTNTYIGHVKTQKKTQMESQKVQQQNKTNHVKASSEVIFKVIRRAFLLNLKTNPGTITEQLPANKKSPNKTSSY